MTWTVCPVCGQRERLPHKCDQAILDRIDAAHEAAGEREPREPRRSVAQRLEEGFRLSHMATPDELERD